MAKKETVERAWYLVDATNIPLGRVASQVAAILRGKNKTCFTPHVDTGDYVIVINAEKAVLTGKKLTDKYYYRHTGWIGGLKEVKYSKLMSERPEFAMELAIKGMLPKNTIGAKSFTRLKVYAGAVHNHEAQKPVPYEG